MIDWLMLILGSAASNKLSFAGSNSSHPFSASNLGLFTLLDWILNSLGSDGGFPDFRSLMLWFKVLFSCSKLAIYLLYCASLPFSVFFSSSNCEIRESKALVS